MLKTHKVMVGSNGRILLPASIRKKMNINTGDYIVVYYDTELHIMPLKAKIIEAQGIVKKYNQNNLSLVESLKKSRKLEDE
jgi:AbrB family looped-hinge helix DNA binding protein